MEEKNNENLENLLDDDLLEDWEWVVSINKLKKKKVWLSNQNKFLIWVIVFLIIIFWLLYWVKYFFTISLKWDHLTQAEQTYINIVKNYILKYVTSISANEKTFYEQNKTPSYNVALMDKFIKDPWIIFYNKQFEKNKFVNNEIENYKNILWNIKATQDLLIKYKFLPKQLNNLIKDIRIMPILLTLNAIKIYMIDYVYIQIWKFDKEILDPILIKSSILSKFNINKSILQDAIKEDIQKIRELWVYFYLKNIKFNYMYNDDSLMSNYYTFYFYKNFQNIFDERAKKFNIKLKDKYGRLTKEGWNFVNEYAFLLKNIYDKTTNLLDNEDVNYLPVNVNLLSYDPKTQKLAFNVDIILQDIYSAKISVIKIATKIVTLLRESRLIIGSDIKMNNIKVQKVSKLIGWTKVTFDKTSLLFNTSVQSKVNVEVTDMNK